jgi:hypothetical protein
MGGRAAAPHDRDIVPPLHPAPAHPAPRPPGGAIAAACAALLAGALGGCSTPPPYDPAAPAIVTLPIAAAGVRDDRARFAAYFERELEAAPPPVPAASAPEAAASAPAGLAAWLHEPPASTPLAERVAALPPQAAAGALRHVAVLVVPGLFGDCVDTQAVPFGDGVVRSREESYTAGYAIYADLGLGDLRALRILGRASSVRDGELVAQELQAEAARPDIDAIVLVAYSKGAADTLHALKSLQAQPAGVPAKVKALVSVSGVVMGTPIADAHASLYDKVAGMMELGGCPPSEGGEIESLARHVRAPWLAQALPLPPIGYYSLVAHAPHDEMSSGLSGFNDDLSEFDPRNDGQMIMSDAILPHATLIGAARSDHWTFVLPLAQHPKLLVRGFASDRPYPRAALFRAVVRYVTDDLALPQR